MIPLVMAVLLMALGRDFSHGKFAIRRRQCACAAECCGRRSRTDDIKSAFGVQGGVIARLMLLTRPL